METTSTSQVEIENVDGIEKVAYDNTTGDRHVLKPFEIRMVNEDLAKLFISCNAHYVRLFQPRVFPIGPGEEVVYVANVTGDPRAPEMLSKSVIIEGRESRIEHKNPLRLPETLRFHWRPSEQVVEAPSGRETLQFSPIELTIPPYRRVALPRHVASFVLTRAGLAASSSGLAPTMRLARAPSDFEPSPLWSLAKTRMYAMLLDSQVFHAAFLNEKFPTGGSEKVEDELKRELLNMLHFWLIDERYTLPTAPAFEKMIAKAQSTKK